MCQAINQGHSSAASILYWNVLGNPCMPRFYRESVSIFCKISAGNKTLNPVTNENYAALLPDSHKTTAFRNNSFSNRACRIWRCDFCTQIVLETHAALTDDFLVVQAVY